MSQNFEYKYLKYKNKYKNLKNEINKKIHLEGGGISEKKKLILFKAEWCGHCKSFKPVWEKLQKEYEKNDDVELVTYDSDNNKLEMLMYKINSFPTILLQSKKGGVEYQGQRNENDIKKFLESNI